jgi:hypothetical protein
MSTEERYVALGEVPESEAKRYLGEAEEMSADGVRSAIPKFSPYSGPMFRAEHAIIGKDLVYHFYVVEQEDPEALDSWFRNTFAAALDAVAQEYFQAGQPRLQAKYTQEMQSWWLRARGFGDGVDPEARVRGLYQKLEEHLRDGN